MGFLEDFRRMVAGDESAKVRVASEAFKVASIALDQAYQKLFTDAVLPWFQRMSMAVPTVWYHPDVRRQCDMTLERGRCSARAAAMCAVCRRNVCLTHSYVCVDATVICQGCVNTARKHVDPVVNAPPGEDERQKQAAAPAAGVDLKAAYKLLGVDPSADMELVEAAYKKLLRRHHPDRVQSSDKKSKAEEKFKQIRAAYDAIAAARRTS